MPIIKFPYPFRSSQTATQKRTKRPIPRANSEAQKRAKEEHEANTFFEHCAFCGKKAPKDLRLCDGRIGGGSLHYHNGEPSYFLCSAPLCEECGATYGDKDYCPFHAQHRDKIIDFPNSGKYAGLRLKINTYSLRTSYGIAGWENPPYMFFCSNIHENFLKGV
ncbi:hypothetical protein [Wielerella bovis]|uniref:hypothetical protein n=1 Tax=Wielerella bovis TaxID=2917790 RepID=UPI00201972AF|nr:hypothetical protein [Wielerella bovis]ULJ64010.1 hypothetical protein MIS33_07520 [Wielerella bovis]ULJ67530.1 hypothetical protein MIS31_02940 [Wielerella bovis]